MQANKEIEKVEGEEKRKEKEEKIELINKRFNRLAETDADNASTLMLFRAGYPLENCLKSIEFSYRLDGLGEATQPKDSHPGYEDRVAAMKIFNEKLRNNPPKKDTNQTKGKWIYR